MSVKMNSTQHRNMLFNFSCEFWIFNALLLHFSFRTALPFDIQRTQQSTYLLSMNCSKVRNNKKPKKKSLPFSVAPLLLNIVRTVCILCYVPLKMCRFNDKFSMLISVKRWEPARTNIFTILFDAKIRKMMIPNTINFKNSSKNSIHNNRKQGLSIQRVVFSRRLLFDWWH